jgi:predicted AlkP superfamily pyrophosphatase or phosphodiesterase
MPISPLRPLALLLLLLCAACARPDDRPVGRSVQPSEPPLVILVSLDGMRPSALHRGDTPRLDQLSLKGVSGSMRPAFPANTFPNHLTLVTGLRPDRHGFVDNKMRDPSIPGVLFDIRDPKTSRDPRWWQTLEPIWVTAERQGIRTGVMFWPGADAEIRGVRPRDWWTYSDANSSTQRIATVLDWARRPPSQRPRFIALYFGMVDQRAHNSGFESAEERAAMREVDTAVGALVDGLNELGRASNILIVSDHGMAPVPANQQRLITDVVDPAIMDAITEGPILDIWPKPGKEKETAAHLSRPLDHITCLPKEKLPARYRFGTHPRAAPWLCMADLGWSFLINPKGILKGEHGYDPESEEMAALFIAAGPSFKTPLSIARFDNVHLYPLLARLIGMEPQPHDGDAATLDPILRAP